MFVVGVVNDLIPHYFSSTSAQVAEERRLLFVAMTRARRALLLVVPDKVSRFANQEFPASPCPFVSHLRTGHHLVIATVGRSSFARESAAVGGSHAIMNPYALSGADSLGAPMKRFRSAPSGFATASQTMSTSSVAAAAASAVLADAHNPTELAGSPVTHGLHKQTSMPSNSVGTEGFVSARAYASVSRDGSDMPTTQKS